VAARIGEGIFRELDVVDGCLDTIFRCQLALTLAVERTETPVIAAPPRFNFPNDFRIWDHYTHDAADLRLLHICAWQQVNKAEAFVDESTIGAMLERTDVSVVNQLLQARVRELRDQVLDEL
jgi:hypothetical protein